MHLAPPYPFEFRPMIAGPSSNCKQDADRPVIGRGLTAVSSDAPPGRDRTGTYMELDDTRPLFPRIVQDMSALIKRQRFAREI